MANMGYCRFRNTVGDLRDCADNMDDFDEEEARARKELIEICVEISEGYGDELDD